MGENHYTGEELISHVLMYIPESYEIFASYGLACAGCPISPLESVRDGAETHGIVGPTFEDLLQDLNDMKAEKIANL